jgi:hypothetical protein
MIVVEAQIKMNTVEAAGVTQVYVEVRTYVRVR